MKKVILLLSAIVICLIGFILNYKIDSNKVIKEILPQKEQVIDEAHFVFKPIYEYNKKQKKLKLLVEITSYIHDDLLNLNYKEISMVEFNNELYKAIEYKIIEKSKHKLIANIIFNPTNFQSTQPFGIRLFTYSDNEINWN
ncbi:MAG: hypothetical protein VW397_00240 [Candidatus Margulisiibacteriota bacterium]